MIMRVAQNVAWSWNTINQIPSIQAESLSTACLVFVNAFRSRLKKPGLFPLPPALLYARTYWNLKEQYFSKESIHKFRYLEPYSTIEHWDPKRPDDVATLDNPVNPNMDGSCYPSEFGGPPDVVDFWYILNRAAMMGFVRQGSITAYIGLLFKITPRTVLRRIHSYYDDIEKARAAIQEEELRPLLPPVDRPSRGMANRKNHG